VTTPRDEWRLDTRLVGRRVLVFDEVDSTNTRAAAMGDDPRADGLVLLADVQSGGRGQYGRSWQCPPRSGVLMSVLLFPPASLRRPALLTAWAAVSVCELLRSEFGLPAGIKWPNDVLVQGRKVCGILIECGASAAGDFRVVAGVGLNLNQTDDDFASAGLPGAGSLLTCTGRPHGRDAVARRLLHLMDEEYARLLRGDFTPLEESWRRGIGLLGKVVRAECVAGRHEGRLVGMSWDALSLNQADGEALLTLPPEAVRGLTEII
jgi:BirA family biotin operon repressor/biotin-[acetyl-CoA-carboxylase] ligase